MSKPTTPGTERYKAHTDADRDGARARLRLARRRFEAAERAYWQAVEERQQAAAHAWEVGVADSETGQIYGIPAGHIGRMRARVAGQDTYAARRLQRSAARQTNRRTRT